MMVLPVVGVMTKNLGKISLNAELVSSESDSSAKNRFRESSVLLAMFKRKELCNILRFPVKFASDWWF